MMKIRHLLFAFTVVFLSPLAQAFSLPSSNSSPFLPVDQAFQFNFYQQGNTLYAEWEIEPGYYLYQHAFDAQSDTAQLGALQLPTGINYTDNYFGDVIIYRDSVTLALPITATTSLDSVSFSYQGCADAGLCYPPETYTVPLQAVSGGDDSANNAPSATNTPAPNITLTTSSGVTSEQNSLADRLSQSGWTPLLFLALGIGLAFTPCVLPMYPILSGIVLGNGKRSHRQALGLALVYVQGMALTYTLLGLVVASAGMQFQAAMQQPWVLGGLSALFIVLAMSMFGVYTLQMPSAVQTWLHKLSNKQEGGQWLGVFAMGAISGLVCSPCTTAPLSGALLYVAQSGDLLTGGLALYALAIGMGIPLIIVAVFGNKLLPRAGAWMEQVKIFFGFVLLAVPLFLLERFVAAEIMTYLWAALGIAFFGWLYHIRQHLNGGWRHTLVSMVAILGLLGAAQPLFWQWWAPTSAQTAPAHQVTFQQVKNLDELNAALASAKAEGKPVMLDFYADWCVACKEFEEFTFHSDLVEPILADFVLLQADVTKNTPTDFEMLNALDVLGLPTIDFWDATGEHRPDARVTGFMNAERFRSHIEAAALDQAATVRLQ
uniref:protein-disulfide reductase DsbD n=1 Tax=Thaumasiovibrio occultus TaxID=1891184 RepID=UPI000B35C73D|nr:protein-disulfide reductase DsbD [Thaumasiovibrio occultus]